MGSQSDAAEKAAEEQARVMKEQAETAKAQAIEAARQSSIQVGQAQAREAATENVRTNAEADAKANESPEIQLGTPKVSTTRKRQRYNAPATNIQTVSI